MNAGSSSRNPQAEQVEVGTRVCRWCRRRYFYPKGRKSNGCPRCAPTLDDAIDEPEGASDDSQPDTLSALPAPTDAAREWNLLGSAVQLPNPWNFDEAGAPDRPLCATCRRRDADALEHAGRGDTRPICFDCLELIVERESAVHASPALRELLPALSEVFG